MAVKRKTINLSVNGNLLVPTDAATGLSTTDAGIQGEDQAVWLHVDVPTDWQDLFVRLEVIALDGSYDDSDYPVANAINMPIRQGVTVPGRLAVRLKGADSTGAIRKTADCKTLRITESAYPNDPIPHDYPNIIRQLVGAGGALVEQVDDTTWRITVQGAGGDMLAANYANGSGAANLNKVDNAMAADQATKAIQDKNGLDIPSSYMKKSDYVAGIGGSNSNKVDRAGAADSATSGSSLALLISSISAASTWVTPTTGFSNNWTNYGGSQAFGYTKDSLGYVHLRGLIKSGTIGQISYQFPSGFRPSQYLLASVPSNGAYGQINIDTNGNLTPTTGSNSYVSLDEIVFSTF